MSTTRGGLLALEMMLAVAVPDGFKNSSVATKRGGRGYISSQQCYKNVYMQKTNRKKALESV